MIKTWMAMSIDKQKMINRLKSMNIWNRLSQRSKKIELVEILKYHRKREHEKRDLEDEEGDANDELINRNYQERKQ